MADQPEQYCGRFAPTPSGPLHLGSLVTAVGSWLDARHHGGRWELRIDDIDPPREQAGAADQIQRQLEAFGLHWDGRTLFQSRHEGRYAGAVSRLIDSGQAFHCRLSRSDLAALDYQHPGVRVAVVAGNDTAIRLTVDEGEVCFEDALCGRQCQNLEQAGGAFVIRRRDGLYAYQLACAVDDSDGHITHVLRGDDLLDSTFRQLHVMHCLGLTPPRYGHLPVLRDDAGDKLSKSAGSAALDQSNPGRDLQRALAHLGIPVPETSPEEQLALARQHWRSPFQGGGASNQPLT